MTDEEGEVWKRRARSAAGIIDCLLLYATSYPKDSHALNGYAFLKRLNDDLGITDTPRTAATFERAAEGRYVLPPYPEFSNPGRGVPAAGEGLDPPSPVFSKSWGVGLPSEEAAREQIVAALAAEDGEIGPVVQRPSGVPISPEEIWIEAIGCWARSDGTSASFDQGRGAVYFKLNDATAINAAVRAWKGRHASSSRPASLDDPA